MLTVNGWKPLTIITKSSTLDVAAVLDPPLDLILGLFLACPDEHVHMHIYPNGMNQINVFIYT